MIKSPELCGPRAANQILCSYACPASCVPPLKLLGEDSSGISLQHEDYEVHTLCFTHRGCMSTSMLRLLGQFFNLQTKCLRVASTHTITLLQTLK